MDTISHGNDQGRQHKNAEQSGIAQYYVPNMAQRRNPYQNIAQPAIVNNLGDIQPSNTLAADVDLVVYGIAKHITEKGLYDHLRSKGLNVVRVTRLTTYEHARSLTFKITVKASDNEKSQDSAMWPTGVSVRLFREKKPRHNRSAETDELNERNEYRNKTSFAVPKSVSFTNDRQYLVQDGWLRPPPTQHYY